MTTLSARFSQSPVENKRYVMDYTLQLASGEGIASIAANIIQVGGPTTGPAFEINSIALLPPVNGVVLGAAFFATDGADACQYEVQFLATTTIGQILEDIVQFNLAEKI
jgi:hypothetical protein